MEILIAFGILAVLGMFLLSVYNGLVRARNLVKNSFSQIDVQLKRRYDLIPNLVETAKGYLKHERDTLERVIQARNHAFASLQSASQNPADGQKMKNLLASEGELGQAMGRLMVVMESYPELKANTTMNGLMEEISSTENKIAFARQAYNDSVMTYNNQREVFPNSLIAGTFGFQVANSYEITQPQERENVKVAFS